MNKHFFRTLLSASFVFSGFLVLVGFTHPLVKFIQSNASVAQNLDLKSKRTSSHLKIADSFGRLPLFFEANDGQISRNGPSAAVKFFARGSGYSIFITPKGPVISIRNKSASKKLILDEKDFRLKDSVALRMNLDGANPKALVEGLEELRGVSNYLISRNSRKWKTGVRQFAKVKIKEVYPGIDIVYYGNQRKLEYDFIVSPGADPKMIQIHYRGAQGAVVDKFGNLVLHAGDGEIIFKAPDVYQMKGGIKTSLEGRYVLSRQNEVRFEVENYDLSLPLIIDPVLDYSTYLGGGNGDFSYSVAVDGSGNAYVAGGTNSINFPTTFGAYQTSNAGSDDIFLLKLNPTGTSLIYSTYLGGTGIDDADAVAIDSSGNAYISGSTTSTDFPTTAGAYQTTLKGGTYDAFITKLNSSGTGLVYSTYLGGSGSDKGSYEIAIDSAGNAYVTGQTWSSDFPVTPGAYKTSYGGNGDVFITKLNSSGTSLVYSTYLGGTKTDIGNGIAVDSIGSAYVTGSTYSGDFQTTAGAFQTSFSASFTNAFVTKLNAAGTALVYSTYLGGSENDSGFVVAVDSNGNAYVAGNAGSVDFPATSGAYQTTNPSGGSFVTKINETGTALIYSTFLGAGGGIGVGGMALNSTGNVFVAGIASSGFPTTAGAYQTTISGGSDALLLELNSTGTGLIYSTYLGGSSGAAGEGIAVDGTGSVYIVGTTNSTDFPTTNGAVQPTNYGYQDVFITKFDAAVFYTPTMTPSNTPTNSATDTPIDTSTSTSTNTATNTPTTTPTNTVTNTSDTQTPTDTPTNSTTNTVTNTATNTANTATPTNTATDTPTSSATNTSTYTPVFTATSTPTSTSTSTIVGTSTPTPTPTYPIVIRNNPGLSNVTVNPNPWNTIGPMYVGYVLKYTCPITHVTMYSLAYRPVFQSGALPSSAGYHYVPLSLSQSKLANGLYFLVVTAGSEKIVLKVLILH